MENNAGAMGNGTADEYIDNGFCEGYNWLGEAFCYYHAGECYGRAGVKIRNIEI